MHASRTGAVFITDDNTHKKNEGKLRYIHGIPYLSGKQIQVTQDGNFRGLVGRLYTTLFGARYGSLVFGGILLLIVLLSAAGIDLLIRAFA